MYSSNSPCSASALMKRVSHGFTCGSCTFCRRRFRSNVGLARERVDAAVDVGLAVFEHLRIEVEARKRLLGAVRDVGEIGHAAVDVPRGQSVLGLNARRAERHCAVVHAHGVEAERKQLLELVDPVHFLAELRLLLALRLHQVHLRTVQIAFGDERAAQQAAPLHGRFDAIGLEERHGLPGAGLHDLDALDVVTAAQQREVEILDVTVVSLQRLRTCR